jgi:hypothetical protein
MVGRETLFESTEINMDLAKKLREICDKIKERNPTKSVSVDMVCWDYQSGEKHIRYKVWIKDGNIKDFTSLEDLIAYEKSLPVRNPILFRKFKI